MSDFLPDDYKVPTTSNYMSFEKGDNRFRVLSKPIIGWVYWVDEEGKRIPKRVRKYEDIPANVQNATDRQKQAKHFWAMVVWNYKEARIQILEITQKGVMNSLKTLIADPDWGAPFGYDIVVNREGDGLDTKYQTNPKPQKELDQEVKDLYGKSNIDLEALYKNENPFKDEVREKEEVEDLDNLPI